MTLAFWSTILIGFATAFGSVASASGEQDELAAARTLVENFYGEFERQPFDVDRLMRLYDPGVKFLDPTFDIQVEGIAAVRDLYAGAGSGESRYRGITWTIERVLASGADVAVLGVWSGQFDGKPFSVEFVTLWVLRDGRIIEQRDFFDAPGFDAQVDWKPDGAD